MAAVSGVDIPPSPRSHFRPDIEGLRAVAIIAVLLYHVRLPGFPGGFIGVDVFYVISGFLITGLLRRELLNTGRVGLVSFYARRARRLLPAALVVIVVTLVASAFVLSSLRFPDVAGDGAAAAGYVSNYRFALSATDYLAATDPSPFQHYWSLGVEEQFYLVWPLLIVLGSRLLSVSRLGWLLVPVALASLALSLVWTDQAAPWAFFSLPTRAWELAVGALIAVGVLRLPAPAGTRTASVLGLAGLGLIVGGSVLIGADTPYPGTAALVPVVGTALLIVAGERAASIPSRWLATAIPRWFGRISYSLYLWHWPLLILVPIALGTDDLAVRLVLGVIAIGIAALSAEYVEAPIRDGRVLRLVPPRSLALAGAASVVVAVGALAFGGILPQLPSAPAAIAGLPGATANPDGSLTADATGGPGSSIAFTATPLPGASGAPSPGPSGSVPATPSGGSGSPGSPTPGVSTPPGSPTPSASTPSGSQAPSATPVPPTPTSPPPAPSLPPPDLSGPLPAGLQPSLKQARQDLPSSYSDGCHLDFTTTQPGLCVYGDASSATTVVLFGDSHAAQWLPALQRLAQEHDWRLVSLTKSACPPVNVTVWLSPYSRAYRECGTWKQNALARIAAEHPALVVVGAARNYQVVQGGDLKNVTDVPDAWQQGLTDVLSQVVPDAGRTVFLADTPQFPNDPLECLASHATIEQCPSPRATLVDPAYAQLEAAAAAAAGADLISPTDWICPGTTCPLVMGTYLVYRDTGHLTATFAALLAPELDFALGSVP